MRRYKYLLILVICFIVGCSTSRTKFVKLNSTDYEIVQYGKADVELNEKGIIKIKNPQSTLSGGVLFIKGILTGLAGKLSPTAEIGNKK